jgi:hypothetical protein
MKEGLIGGVMAKSKSLPEYVLRVSTYVDLEPYIQAFAEGHLNLLILCGAPGIGKSRQVQRAVGDKGCWIDGNASAFGVYMQAYEHRHRPIILDDVDGLSSDPRGVRLLKALGQSEKVKSLSWETDAKTLDSRGIPRQFTTTSRVVIIANQWKSLNADVSALEDRGHFLHFAPTAWEIHSQAASWFWDQGIYDFVAEHLHLIANHSLRTYVLAWELKSAGLDWKQGILSRFLLGTALEVARLRSNPAFKSEAERVQAFVASGAGCRASYFNHAKKLQAGVDKPRCMLRRLTPPADVTKTIS